MLFEPKKVKLTYGSYYFGPRGEEYERFLRRVKWRAARLKLRRSDLHIVDDQSSDKYLAAIYRIETTKKSRYVIFMNDINLRHPGANMGAGSLIAAQFEALGALCLDVRGKVAENKAVVDLFVELGYPPIRVG